jgi:hypothetical protein
VLGEGKGCLDGSADGWKEGRLDGITEGITVGHSDGTEVGESEGFRDISKFDMWFSELYFTDFFLKEFLSCS